MLARGITLAFCLLALDTVLGMSYAFSVQVTGRLRGPIRFDFHSDTTKRMKTDIESLTVSVRTADHRWKAIWSISEGRRVTQPIEYGVPPAGFTTRIAPQRLLPGRVYLVGASAGHGGIASRYFGFHKDGAITFPDSPD